MALTKEQAFELALKNVSNYGDTDIFPFPIENLIFFDEPIAAKEILTEIDTAFDQSLEQFPLLAVKSLAAVGYSGFRWGTQIDPIWNAYLLSLVLRIGDDIEKARVPIERNVVFSYRYKPDTGTGQLFDSTIGWVGFQKHSVELARNYAYVLECDISDFYPRIYHHRLENALKKATKNSDVINQIKDILFRISEHVSYGLPVGGPAARLLSELLLNRIDRLLLNDEVVYCRFVDDFHIFANSKEEAHRVLVRLSELLMVNEGLSLQKTKTRILTSAEFLATSSFADENKPENTEQEEARSFTRIRLKYDPYSPTSEQDYEALKSELSKFDIVGMLGRELLKSRIDEGLTRRLLSAIRHISDDMKNQAISSMMQSLEVLYPVFPAVMILVRGVIDELSKETKEEIFVQLRSLIKNSSYITQVPANMSFALRVLALDSSEETEAILARLFREPLNMMFKRDIILMMANRGADYWISNCRKQYSVLTQWERRALIVSSYILEDEGKHWREGIKKELSSFDQLILKWAASKKSAMGHSWVVPI
jgi:hypothetical protein